MKRALIVLVITLIAAPPAGAEVYRWVDDRGVTHYSDQPVKGASKPDLPRLQSMQAPAVPAGNDSGAAIGEDSGGLSLVRPGTDETFRDARGLVPVQVELERELAEGETLQYVLDGEPVAGADGRRTSLQLQGVPRGTHAISAVILRGEEPVARSQAVTFHMKPPSALSPANRQDVDAGAPTAPGSTGAAGAPAAPRLGGGP
ncbi:DUF4124 domain-containing protein [Spectribacter hydrogenoxidans]|uniref:DUF4124 domain-containing protein n=1 Tax=Spectribacter hydrogenoxidans TaxID=3075608 RepID=A0ABU3BWB6_9GAMM|nr:DUF4124 domain-containing protein [Salinisphaera sp. W335]MDT0633588.1 DUF4124 domain-containing protein [Salinisphaera sp. W335]